jgi:hypothetical protein
MTENLSRRAFIPAVVAAGVATSVGAANASPAPVSLISLETIKKANELIRDRNALVEAVRGLVGIDRLSIQVPKKRTKKHEEDNSYLGLSLVGIGLYDSAHLSLNDGYDPAFRQIRDIIRVAATAQLRRVEAKMTTLGIDFESDVGSNG